SSARSLHLGGVVGRGPPRLRYAGTFGRSEAVLGGKRAGRLSGRPEASRAVGSSRGEGFQACSPEPDRTNAPPAPAEEIRRAEQLDDLRPFVVEPQLDLHEAGFSERGAQLALLLGVKEEKAAASRADQLAADG